MLLGAKSLPAALRKPADAMETRDATIWALQKLIDNETPLSSISANSI